MFEFINTVLLTAAFAYSGSSNSCPLQCNHEAERAVEQCQYDADTSAEQFMSDSGPINLLDGQSMLDRTRRLQLINAELKRCTNRIRNEHRRCVQAC